MSSVYVLEPPTKGKVVVQTTAGPLDIELWPKEAPKAARNFVQLCLEGYYDGTLFHRVIKSFLVQGGDPTGSGTGGESIYGAPFADEFHSRLRFNHRGLVACANAGTPHSNGSQFFITLDRCDWLDKKNTIFGKVTGDSIFNLLALADVETDKDDRPVYPQKILSVEVLWDPFEDVVPRQLKKPESAAKADAEVKPKKKAVKQLNVLSFGDEVEEEENEAASSVKDKIKSIHDVLDDPRFLKGKPEDGQLSKEQEEKKKDTLLSVREALISKKVDSREPEHAPETDDYPEDENEEDFDNRMRSQILRKRRELGDICPPETSKTDKPHRKDRELPAHRSDINDDDDDQEHQLQKSKKLSLKKKGVGSEASAESMSKADANLQLLNPAEQERHLQKQKKRRLQGREDETLAKLQKFKASFLGTNRATDNTEKEADEDYTGWHTNRLTFMPDSSKDGMARKDDPDDYVVVDPLLENGKQKFNKMQAKLKRREREWAGRSLT
ncbi:peptidyl-prolyl cis-trans isomerase CYP57-like [Phragmites australis]|uniref:peptidyl-prolyl cis-trans isomerase CYP57-like n=1 Tax=Phragmites australis TaxID=29695 RepID=UPI002D782360|nr:peptidyl-prolyl cis-trans isomerase CYP57-like [Phragmites australis]